MRKTWDEEENEAWKSLAMERYMGRYLGQESTRRGGEEVLSNSICNSAEDE